MFSAFLGATKRSSAIPALQGIHLPLGPRCQRGGSENASSGLATFDDGNTFEATRIADAKFEGNILQSSSLR